MKPALFSQIQIGLFAAISAYTIWGLLPVYFTLTAHVPALEILAHRIIWAVPFGGLLITLRRQWPEVIQNLKIPKRVMILFLASLTLACNWAVYILAVQNNEVFQGSLGYYINPLFYVLVGMIFFHEKLSPTQMIATLLAVTGVSILIFHGNTIPYISLILATSFTIYGIIRKQVNIGAMPGLFIETLLLLPPALLYIIYLHQAQQFHFNLHGPTTSQLLMLAGPITVIPLFAFATSARILNLSTIGFLQFIGPSLQFACGLYYGERFTSAHAWCFGFIWLAVLFFSMDAIVSFKKNSSLKQQSF